MVGLDFFWLYCGISCENVKTSVRPCRNIIYRVYCILNVHPCAFKFSERDKDLAAVTETLNLLYFQNVNKVY